MLKTTLIQNKMKKKGNIIFDLDNTLIESRHIMIEYMNSKWGINSIERDYYDDDNLHAIVNKYRNGSPVSRKEFYDDYVANLILSMEWNRRIKPVLFLKEIIESFSREHNLYIATKRLDISARIVNQMLKDYHIAQYIEDVYYAIRYINFFGNRYLKLSKGFFMKNLPRENIAFVDDSLHEIEKTKDIVPSYLIDPLNMYGEVTGITKATNLVEFASIISQKNYEDSIRPV